MSAGKSDSTAAALDYASAPARRNTAAAVALLFGLMLFIPLVPGVLAIKFARRGIRDARDYALGAVRMARIALVLGAINVAGWCVLTSAYVVHARREAMMAACRQNLRSIARAVMVYANRNRGQPPPTFDLIIGADPYVDARALHCPACPGNVGRSDYVIAGPWNPPPNWKQVGVAPHYLVVAWEPPSNHNGRGMHVVFDDHRIEWMTGANISRINAELRAGLNPPPVLDARAASEVAWLATTRRAAATRSASTRSTR